MTTTDQHAVTRDDALTFADEAFRNRDITFSHRDVVDMAGALSTFLQRHRLGATAIASAEQSAATPWLAWPARKTWEEVRVRLRSRDGNEWEEIASDFEYWMQSADGEMCDDVVAFQIIGETPLGLASVSSASAEGWKLVPCSPTEEMQNAGRQKMRLMLTSPRAVWSAMLAASPEPVPATNQAGEVAAANAVEKYAINLWDRHPKGRGYHSPEWSEISERQRDAMRIAALREMRCDLAALATQPATSQEGGAIREAFSGVMRGEVVNAGAWSLNLHFGRGDGARDRMRAASSLLGSIVAATPTPPTLSEDLREALKPFADIADFYDSCEQHPNGCPDSETTGEMVDLTVGDFRRVRAALAQVKAS